MKCRNCNHELTNVFCDLQTCPPSNAMLTLDELNTIEKYFPLKVFVCEKCWLVQIDEIEKAEEIFNSEYTYFSSFSSTWLEHAEKYTEYMIDRFGYNDETKVIEIASNDGYLLQFFKAKGIKVLGIEPTSNTAEVAIKKGINCIVDFFNSKLAIQSISNSADLILGNNVLAHVPDINDFVKGVKIALKKEGIATFEFPHLCKLIEFNQFDTIYHEHYSYLSLISVINIFEKNGLEIFDVQELNTHGGSLRIFAKHKEDTSKQISDTFRLLLAKEKKLGVDSLLYYEDFQQKANFIRNSFIEFLLNQKKLNKKIIAYGAAAKGNTLLNYSGIKGSDLISFVVDKSPFKQGKYLPGSRIPVLNESEILKFNPDYVIIFPWNLSKEISEQLKYIKKTGCKFVTFIPKFKTF
jgi:2-polyprenyl-3-methyl-5-hydroxy-6-metoxy-1,4-benzoquinol methylase